MILSKISRPLGIFFFEALADFPLVWPWQGSLGTVRGLGAGFVGLEGGLSGPGDRPENSQEPKSSGLLSLESKGISKER